MNITNNITIDATMLLCPLPVIRLGEAMQKVAIGDTITINATDYGVLHDIPAWCKVHHQEVISINEDEIITIIVKKIN
jgi:tRNA 2-thiouridine synthesizing protein A